MKDKELNQYHDCKLFDSGTIPYHTYLFNGSYGEVRLAQIEEIVPVQINDLFHTPQIHLIEIRCAPVYVYMC